MPLVQGYPQLKKNYWETRLLQSSLPSALIHSTTRTCLEENITFFEVFLKIVSFVYSSSCHYGFRDKVWFTSGLGTTPDNVVFFRRIKQSTFSVWWPQSGKTWLFCQFQWRGESMWSDTHAQQNQQRVVGCIAGHGTYLDSILSLSFLASWGDPPELVLGNDVSEFLWHTVKGSMMTIAQDARSAFYACGL